MQKLICRNLSIFLSSIFILFAQTATAQSWDQYDERAERAFDGAVSASSAGQYDVACRGFNNAATLWENGIVAFLSKSMSSEAAREEIKRQSERMQQNANTAKSNARDVCGKTNNTNRVTPVTAADRYVQTPQDFAFRNKKLSEVVYPAIDRLGVYIEKSRAERLATGSWVEVNREWCYTARHELTQVAFIAEEAMLCQAIALWLQDKPKESCDYLVRDQMKDFFRKSTFAALVSYYNRVYYAAGCLPKMAAPPPNGITTPVNYLEEATKLRNLGNEQLAANNTLQGCASLRQSHGNYASVMAKFSDNETIVKETDNLMAIISQSLQRNRCPAMKTAVTNSDKAFESWARGNVASAIAVRARQSNDFNKSCLQFKSASELFSNAQRINMYSRTDDGYEELPAGRVNNFNSVFTASKNEAAENAATDCAKSTPIKP